MSKFNYYNRYSITILSLILFATSVISQPSSTFPPGTCCFEPPDSKCRGVVCNGFEPRCCQTEWIDWCDGVAHRICNNLFNFTSNATTFEPTTTTQTTNAPTPSPTQTTTQTATSTNTTLASTNSTFPPELCCLEPADTPCQDLVCNEFDSFCCQTQWDDQCRNLAYRICHGFTRNATTSEPTTTSFRPTPIRIPTRAPSPSPAEADLCCAYPLDAACKEYVCHHVDPYGRVCCDVGWDYFCDYLAHGVCDQFSTSSTAEPSTSLQPTTTSTATTSTAFESTNIDLCCTYPLDEACKEYVCYHVDPYGPGCCRLGPSFGWESYCDAMAYNVCHGHSFNTSSTVEPSTSLQPTPLPIPTRAPFRRRPDVNPCCDCVRPSEFAGCPGKHGCEGRICSRDRFCCARKWDIVCAVKADAICKGIETAKCCECTNHQNGRGGCVADQECAMQICNADPFCCYSRWDLRCVNAAFDICVQQSRL